MTPPRRELAHGNQVQGWLLEASRRITLPAEIVLIGFAGLLWHAARRGVTAPAPDRSMDIDPAFATECLIGSDFERTHGFHINAMPREALLGLAAGWETRAAREALGILSVVVPSPADLLVPKLRRGEPQDIRHRDWAEKVGLLS